MAAAFLFLQKSIYRPPHGLDDLLVVRHEECDFKCLVNGASRRLRHVWISVHFNSCSLLSIILHSPCFRFISMPWRRHPGLNSRLSGTTCVLYTTSSGSTNSLFSNSSQRCPRIASSIFGKRSFLAAVVARLEVPLLICHPSIFLDKN